MTVAGSATIECDPDLLAIILRIQYLHPDSAALASDEVAKMIEQLLNALKNLGISKEDMETTGYRIKQIYEWEYYDTGNKEKRVFKGFKVINTIKITVKDFDKGGKEIDAAADVGALVDNINFELSREKREELKLQAMAMVVKDAKLKAVTIITALVVEFGHVTSVNLNNYNYQPYNYWTRSDLMVEGFSEKEIVPPTTILPGDLTVSANVNVVFDIL
jgi:uncharacterized protein YggE